MANSLLMPKATAVWLIDNTGLTFEQIAAFCTLHALEVQGIADGDVAGGVMGVNPMQAGQLTKEEITAGEADPAYRLKLSEPKVHIPETKRRGPRYTPISRRNERPNAIKWLVRNHPELKDAQIIRLVGTTKSTIETVRDGAHWNNANLTMMDPVTLGLCSQINLDMEVKKANKGQNVPDDADAGVRLMSAEEALSTAAGAAAAAAAAEDGEQFSLPESGQPIDSESDKRDDDIDVDAVFAKLTSLKSDAKED